MKSEFEIARIVKPRGLKGEMKVEFYSSDVARLSHLKKVKICGVEHAVERIVADGQYGFIKIKDVDSAEEAELLRDAIVCADRNELPPLPKDRYYIADMLGMEVCVGGDIIGTLTDVLQYGSADVYVVKTKDGSLSFPALKQVVEQVDFQSGKIVLNDVMFSRVVVYN